VFFGPIAQGSVLDVDDPGFRISSPQIGLSDWFGIAILIEDVTGDGVPDLVVGAPAEGEEACIGTLDLGVWPGPLGPGQTTLEAAPRRLAAPSGTCLGNTLQLAELDGKPGRELFVGGATRAEAVALPLGDAPSGSPIADGYYAVGAIDVDGDGRDDVVFAHGEIALASDERSELALDPAVYAYVASAEPWASGAAGLLYETRTPGLRALVPGVSRIEDLPLVATLELDGEVSIADLDGDGAADLIAGDRLLRCR
jgi:hypothetical protein